MGTVTYIAKPSDSRCQWWSVILPKDLSVDSLEKKIDAPFLKRGADLELTPGTMIIDSEAMHHRNNRGYRVNLGYVWDDKVIWISPNIDMKKYIKEKGHQDLMVGSGDVAACVRIALYLQRVEDMEAEIKVLIGLEK